MGHDRHQASSGVHWIFHPYEMALVGGPVSVRTSLATRLVPLLGRDVASIRVDMPDIDGDLQGTSPRTLTDPTASAQWMADPTHRALIRRKPWDPILGRLDSLEEDVALVEGHPSRALPKILVLDPSPTVLTDSTLTDCPPLAAVGPWGTAPKLPWAIPYFSWDDAQAVASWILDFWKAQTAERPLLGLVLTGGQSSRMGRDKAALVYQGQPEAKRVFDLLGTVCSEVFISCRDEQTDLPGRRGLPQIHDVLPGHGPLSGILAAFEARPDAAWLVVACDLPRIDPTTLETLVAGRNPYRFATAFRGHEGFPEPLCTLYEPKARPRLLQFLAAGYDCPRKMLINSPVQILDPLPGNPLVNANTPEEANQWGLSR